MALQAVEDVLAVLALSNSELLLRADLQAIGLGHGVG